MSSMNGLFSKGRTSKGVTKGRAMVWSCLLSALGYLVLKCMHESLTEWLTPQMFIEVWILFFFMLHKPVLDEDVEFIYDYEIETKDFIDDDDLVDHLSYKGQYGWDVVAIRADQEVNMRFKILFRKKAVSPNKKTKK